jgi:hypothetical protein
MGMYDIIKIDKLITLPKPEGFEHLNVHELEYQTKDLDCSLNTYKLTPEGLLRYEVKREWIEDNTMSFLGGSFKAVPNTEKWLLENNITNYISFYQSCCDITPTQDAWVEYVAHIVEGQIKEVKLFRFELCDNSERKESAAQLGKLFQSYKNRKKYQILIDDVRIYLRRSLNRLNKHHIKFAYWIKKQIFKI